METTTLINLSDLTLEENMKKSFVKKIIALSLATLPFAQAAMTTVNAQDNDVVTVEITAEEEEAFKSEPKANEAIKVAYSGGDCTGIIGVALTEGFYEEEGLQIEIYQAASNSDALGTGQADVTAGHISTNVIPIANDVGYTTLTGLHVGCKSLYVLNNDEINDTADLVGQIVAVPEGTGSSDQNIAFRFFNNDGIDPLDINYRQVDSGAAVQAVESGEIQGVILTDKFAWDFVENGTLKRVRSLSFDEDFSQEACCAFYANNDFVTNNPVAAKKVARAIQRTREWAAENPEDFVDALYANDWTTGDRDTTVDYIKSLDYKVSDATTEATLKAIIADYQTFGFMDADKTVEELMEMIWSPQN